MSEVLTVADVTVDRLESLLDRYGLRLVLRAAQESITGSFWGEPEAGVVGTRVIVRPDTPVHSLLHEACHIICMDDGRRHGLHRDAGGDDLEEAAVCYLQILLAEEINGLGSERLMADMDRWGYSFRLGSTRAWFQQDAEDAKRFLLVHGLISEAGEPTWKLRH